MKGFIKFMKVVTLMSLGLLSTTTVAQSFKLHDLPSGKSVTLPRPATTQVPLNSSVRLTATDRDQTLKLSAKSNVVVPWQAFTLAIYDRNSEKVRYVELSPKASMVYSFRDMAPIQIITKAKGSNQVEKLWLEVESNKPLTIAR